MQHRGLWYTALCDDPELSLIPADMRSEAPSLAPTAIMEVYKDGESHADTRVEPVVRQALREGVSGLRQDDTPAAQPSPAADPTTASTVPLQLRFGTDADDTLTVASVEFTLPFAVAGRSVKLLVAPDHDNAMLDELQCAGLAPQLDSSHWYQDLALCAVLRCQTELKEGPGCLHASTRLLQINGGGVGAIAAALAGADATFVDTRMAAAAFVGQLAAVNKTGSRCTSVCFDPDDGDPPVVVHPEGQRLAFSGDRRFEAMAGMALQSKGAGLGCGGSVVRSLCSL